MYKELGEKMSALLSEYRINPQYLTIYQKNKPSKQLCIENIDEIDITHTDTPDNEEKFTQLKLITNLFYSNDPLKPPKIYTKIHDTLSIESISNRETCLKNILDKCDTYSKYMESITISKHNMFSSNDDNFHEVLKNSIDQAKEFLTREIEVQKIITKNDPSELTTLIVTTMKRVDQLIELHKRGIKAYNVNTNQSNLIFSAISSTISNASPITTKLCATLPNHTVDTTLVNTGLKILVGITWATSKLFQTGVDAVFHQELGAEKERLLVLCKQLKNLGYEFTIPQKQQLEKVFNIKRGNICDRLFTWNTHSYDEFQEIIGESVKNRDENHCIEQQILSNTAVVTRADISAQIISSIKEKSFDNLINYLNNMPENEKKMIPDIIFEIDGFRGNLLGYLLTQPELTKTDELKKFIFNLYKESPEIEINGLYMEDTKSTCSIQDLQSKKYLELRELLETYKVPNKPQCILDITHIIWAVQTHSTLTNKEKTCLLSFLKLELKAKGDGIFRDIRNKNDTNSQDIILGTIFYNVENCMSDIRPLDRSIQAVDLDIGNGLFGATFSTMVPLANFFSRGSTTTYKNVKQLLHSTSTWLINSNIPSENNTINKPRNAISQSLPKPEYLTNKPKKPLNETIDELKTAMIQLIEKKDINEDIKFNQLIVMLTNSDRDIAYYALTDKMDKSSLLINLLNEFSEPEQDQRIRKIWNSIVDKRYPKDKYMDIHEFKQHVANINKLDNAQSSLIAFHEVIAILNNCKDLENFKEMVEYFSGIIYRAQNDTKSVWHNLLKYSYGDEMVRKVLLRAVATGIEFVVDTAIITATHGLALPIIFCILGLSGGIGGGLSGLENNFTHATTLKTQEYESAIKYLKTCGINLDKRLIDKFQTFKTACHNDDIIELKKLNTKPTILTKYVEGSIFKTNTPLDNPHIQLNYQPKHDQKHVDGLLKITDQEERFNKITTIIQYIDNAVADKFTASEAVLRIIAIISAGIKNKKERLKIMLYFTTQIKQRLLKMSQIISENRSFYTENNYLVPNIAFGALTSLTTMTRLPSLKIDPIYQVLTSVTTNITGTSLMTMLNNTHSNYSSTASFQTAMSFLKDIILDLIKTIDSDKNNSQQNIEDHSYQESRRQGISILNEHTGYWFTQFGDTAHSYT